MAGNLKNIFVHCSATPWGEVQEFTKWHLARGWSGIGYHYVVLNGRPFSDVAFIDFLDGQIQPGRHLDDDPIFSRDERGAHVAGRNSESIGICLVGRTKFTDKQLVVSKTLLLSLANRFSLGIRDILGHYEDPNTEKTCPNIPMDAYREFLADKLTLSDLQKEIYDHVKEIYP